MLPYGNEDETEEYFVFVTFVMTGKLMSWDSCLYETGTFSDIHPHTK